MGDDYTKLGLGTQTSLITNLVIQAWGTEVKLECVYDPKGQRLPYSITFYGCQNIHWEVHDPELADDIEADLIGISLGSNLNQEPAVIYTDIFELSVSYRDFSLEKAGLAVSEQVR
jgi:hypothetical protein